MSDIETPDLDTEVRVDIRYRDDRSRCRGDDRHRILMVIDVEVEMIDLEMTDLDIEMRVVVRYRDDRCRSLGDDHHRINNYRCADDNSPSHGDRCRLAHDRSPNRGENRCPISRRQTSIPR